MLAESLTAEHQLHERRAGVEARLASEREQKRQTANPGRIDLEQLKAADGFESLLRDQLDALANQQRLLAREIDERRQAVTAADRELQIVEKLKDRQWAEFSRAQQLAEAKLLDEIASRPRPDA